MALLEVCLGSDLPVEEYLGNYIHRPDAIVWLVSDENKKEAETVTRLLTQHFEPVVEIRLYKKDDIDEFIAACNKVIEDYPEHKKILNISGGPKLESMIAAEIFKKVETKVVFIDQPHSREVDVVTGKSEIFHFSFTISEYISLHGLEMETGKRFDPEIGKRSALSYFIGNNIDQTVPFLDKCVEEWNHMGNEKSDQEWELINHYINLKIQYTADENKIHTIFNSGKGERTVTITGNGVEYLFKGGWLRELVFLRVHRTQYDDIRLDVCLDRDNMPMGQNMESMIDVSMVRGTQLYVFQCFSFPISRESFTELNFIRTTIDQLKAHGVIFLAHKPYRGFLSRAREAGLDVVFGKRISNFSV